MLIACKQWPSFLVFGNTRAEAQDKNKILVIIILRPPRDTFLEYFAFYVVATVVII